MYMKRMVDELGYSFQVFPLKFLCKFKLKEGGILGEMCESFQREFWVKNMLYITIIHPTEINGIGGGEHLFALPYYQLYKSAVLALFYSCFWFQKQTKRKWERKESNKLKETEREREGEPNQLKIHILSWCSIQIMVNVQVELKRKWHKKKESKRCQRVG